MGDQLLKLLKPAFSDGASVSDDALRKQFGGTPAGKVSASALNDASKGGSVEAFPLVRPDDRNGFTAVNLYLDEVGALKKLTPNKVSSHAIGLLRVIDGPILTDRL